MARTTRTAVPHYPPGDIFEEVNQNKVMSSQWKEWFSIVIDSIPFFRTSEVTLDPGSVAAQTSETETVTFNGVTTNDGIIVNKPSHTAGIAVTGFVSAANTVTIVFTNSSTGAIDPGSEDYKLIAISI